MHIGPVPVLARYITHTVINWCQYRYWHLCILVQHQYWHGTLPALALNGASTSIGIYAFWSSTSIGLVYYLYKWCPYRYWHFCTIGQYQYWYSTLPILVLNGLSTGNVKEHYTKCPKIYGFATDEMLFLSLFIMVT
jgi:hypothetical protein